MSQSSPTQPNRRLSNADWFMYALLEVGGIGKFVDVEDVFVEMWRLAPARFGWRKHEFPNYKSTSKALSEPGRRSGADDLIMQTADGLGRQLTGKGTEWVRQRQDVFEAAARQRRSAGLGRRGIASISELSRSSLLKAFRENHSIILGRNDVAYLLKCAPDSPRVVWKRRVESLRAAAAAQWDDVVRFLEFVVSERPEWFGEVTG